MFRLDGRLALITGASGGVGGAIARAMHRQGASVVLTGTRQDKLDTLAEKLGNRVWTYSVDLFGSDAADMAIMKTEDLAKQPLDILVNNAGLTSDMLAIRMKDEDWDRVQKVDLTAPFRLCRSALKGMVKRRRGRIINISSIVAITGNAGQVNYSAAKAGLIGMSKSLAQEVAGRGITVNVVAPGFIETAMTDALSLEQKNRLIASIPLKRMGKVDDIAAAAVYLASDEAEWLTGVTLHVNGGMAMI